MHIHESAFWGIVFFLVGVFMVPVVNLATWTISIGIGVAVFIFFAYRKRMVRAAWFAGLTLFAIIGALYWTGYNVHQKNKVVSLLGKRATITAHVIKVQRSEKSQRITARIDDRQGGVVSMTTRPYPVLHYGDAITAKGMVKKPDEKNRAYLMKDAIFATMQFPEAKLIRQNDGNQIMMWLLDIRQRSVALYKRLLPQQEAALLAGITLGERAEFDKEFREQMANSGTTHLVALSGYNISVVAEAILLLCGFLMRRTAAFYTTLTMIVAFVMMAGAEASVVRAAIMGSIVLLAAHIGRAHSMRNAIAVSACAMVLWNPNVLRYDLGFQLSFLALIGVIYLKPHMDRVIKRKKNGFMNWRENLSGTFSAQLLVFPILMQAVGSFSFMSLLSNIVILTFIPVTMGLGFTVAGLGFIAQPLAQLPAWVTSLLLKYEIATIGLFGAHKGFSMPMTAMFMIVYYAIMGGLLWRLYKRSIRNTSASLCHSDGSRNPESDYTGIA